MGRLTEMQTATNTRVLVNKLDELIAEQRRTNQLLETMLSGRAITPPAATYQQPPAAGYHQT